MNMKKMGFVVLAGLLLGLPLSARDLSSGEPTLVGDYVEARTSDVYVGPCFANSEVNLTGQEAVLAWRVRQGEWQGVSLEGLSVVAVVTANATLGDPHADPLPARSLLVVEETATPEQQSALVELAQAEAGELLQDIVGVERAPIHFEVGQGHGVVDLRAGDIAALSTRSLHEADKICGFEELLYPPLTEVQDAHPGYTVVHEFHGQGLGTTWKSPDKRSAFVGEFSR